MGVRVSSWRRLGAAAAGLSIVLLLALHVGVLLSFPREFRVHPGQAVKFNPVPLYTLVTVLPETEEEGSRQPGETGGYQVELRFLDWLPVRRAQVKVVPEMSVVPGGQAVGILLSPGGLLVARTTPVTLADGTQRSPAAEAGIVAGDIIVEAGGVAIGHPAELEHLVQRFGRAGEPMPVVVRRGGTDVPLEVLPVLGRDPSGRSMRYLIGAYLRDPAAGVGTLTFWDPVSGRYGALGHMVADGGRPADLSDGRIVAARIQGIQPGARGRPGEKVGLFEPGDALGTIDKNTPVGIFGQLLKAPASGLGPVPVALKHEIEKGKAEILTVLEGGRIESFEVEVVAVERQSRPGGKGLVIRVTDPRLIRRTNGIVQGMSGSPILQNGKLIGAVTHVFINDPLQGYGVLAEWMVYEAGLAAAGAAGDRTGERAAAAGFQPFSDELSGGGVSCWQGAFASSSPTTT
ncbi:MAG: SpoIVB peptidase [Bacillota bacterium]